MGEQDCTVYRWEDIRSVRRKKRREERWLRIGFAAAANLLRGLFAILGRGISGRDGVNGAIPQSASAIGIIGGADGPTAIFTAHRLRPRLPQCFGRMIRFFRREDPLPVDRTKLALALVAGAIAPLVLCLSALVFSSNRRCR